MSSWRDSKEKIKTKKSAKQLLVKLKPGTSRKGMDAGEEPKITAEHLVENKNNTELTRGTELFCLVLKTS